MAEEGNLSHSDDNYITEEILENFRQEAGELLGQIEASLLSLERDLLNTNLIRDIFRHIHTIKGNCTIFAFAKEELLCASVEELLQEVIEKRRVLSHKLLGRLFSFVEEMRSSLQHSIPGEWIDSTEVEPEEESRLLGEILIEMGAVSPAALERALRLQDKSAIGEILLELGEVSWENLDRAVKIQGREKRSSSRSDSELDEQEKLVRIDINKLDNLFDIVGKVMVTGVALVNGRESESGLTLRYREMLKELNQITLSLRMVTMEQLFVKLGRLARQERERSGKRFRLKLSGAEIEMDRLVIQQISAPLIHMLRNAIDHGLETVEERLARGKSESGTISIEACYRGEEILIKVIDDGSGLDREKILARAYERGQLVAGELELTDNRIWSLIYEPGFSTADREANLSGRGMGMNVVKRNIELIDGLIELRSWEGEGTEVSLRIPLTQNIIEGLKLRVGEQLYLVHTACVDEYFFYEPLQLLRESDGYKIINSEYIKIPAIRFNRREPPLSGVALVIIVDNERYCLLVDDVLGREQAIIKPAFHIENCESWVKGFAALREGEVALVINSALLIAEYRRED